MKPSHLIDLNPECSIVSALSTRNKQMPNTHLHHFQASLLQSGLSLSVPCNQVSQHTLVADVAVLNVAIVALRALALDTDV